MSNANTERTSVRRELVTRRVLTDIAKYDEQKTQGLAETARHRRAARVLTYLSGIAGAVGIGGAVAGVELGSQGAFEAGATAVIGGFVMGVASLIKRGSADIAVHDAADAEHMLRAAQAAHQLNTQPCDAVAKEDLLTRIPKGLQPKYLHEPPAQFALAPPV